MKHFIFILLLTFYNLVYSQSSENKLVNRKGFVFGFALGASYVNLSRPGFANHQEISGSMPNFKFGMMLNNKTALNLYLPGSLYKYKISGRERDRGFEGITITMQYWLKDRWWLMGGGGVCMDAPAFYDIKDSTERKFYFGATIIAGTGYELWRKGKFALDIQSRVQYGYTNEFYGMKKGLALNILVGFNWY
ncbi:MAG: hypothetical protein SFY56_08080 [Bacteroidota bacterium]|nr:hypothetical protein [Bacteroidota bacterium]